MITRWAQSIQPVRYATTGASSSSMGIQALPSDMIAQPQPDDVFRGAFGREARVARHPTLVQELIQP